MVIAQIILKMNTAQTNRVMYLDALMLDRNESCRGDGLLGFREDLVC